ncbi:hypothetical protein [Streptacidiphilus sp. P02-A3a]|uniref:hypothetical protein n=1 Tax=Streptacidiphilus sp. P02-A3a TaxID=2704468 RepID=UPI0015FCDC6B|nr:hypothetical protein [Streptacidiphilus sp. P02-A3a]QMU72114.1 hypothetical protein GXP74_31635 [Streptacidiphilus sp. P02-A3a]
MTQAATQQEREAPSTPGDAPVMSMARRLRAAMAAIGIDIGRPAHPVLGQGGVVGFDFGPIALEDAVALIDLAEAEAASRVQVAELREVLAELREKEDAAKDADGGPVVEHCCGLWVET